MSMVIHLASRCAAPSLPAIGTPDPIQLHADAHNALAMALHYLRQPDQANVAGATRKAVQALSALRRLQPVANKTPASPCTNCRDNFPLPEAADVFDSMVIAGYVERRTACGMCSANEKPCLDMGAQQGGGV